MPRRSSCAGSERMSAPATSIVPGGRLDQPVDHPQRRGLAAARRAHQRHQLPGGMSRLRSPTAARAAPGNRFSTWSRRMATAPGSVGAALPASASPSKWSCSPGTPRGPPTAAPLGLSLMSETLPERPGQATSWFGRFLSVDRQDVDDLAALAGAELHAPGAVANSVSSPPRPTFSPGWNRVPRWRTMIDPAVDDRAVEHLHAEALGGGVAPVLGGAGALGLRHVVWPSPS